MHVDDLEIDLVPVDLAPDLTAFDAALRKAVCNKGGCSEMQGYKILNLSGICQIVAYNSVTGVYRAITQIT